MNRDEFVSMAKAKLKALEQCGASAHTLISDIQHYLSIDYSHQVAAALAEEQEDTKDRPAQREYLIEQLAAKSAQVQMLESQIGQSRIALSHPQVAELGPWVSLVSTVAGFLEPLLMSARRDLSAIQESLERMDA